MHGGGSKYSFRIGMKNVCLSCGKKTKATLRDEYDFIGVDKLNSSNCRGEIIRKLFFSKLKTHFFLLIGFPALIFNCDHRARGTKTLGVVCVWFLAIFDTK